MYDDLLKDIEDDISGDWEDIQKRIQNNIEKNEENKPQSIEDKMKMYASLGAHLSEASYRATGRTSRMIDSIVVHMRIFEEKQKILSLGVFVHKHPFGTYIIKEIANKISDNMRIIVHTRDFIETSFCRIRIMPYRQGELPSHYSFDDIYIDDACFDLERNRLRRYVSLGRN